MTFSHEERLKQIKQAGQSIIDNAESILGTESYRNDLIITVKLLCHQVPEIIVKRTFIPEGVIDEHK